MRPFIVEISTRLRADWQSRANPANLSKPKQATFAQDAHLMPFTAEPVRAVVIDEGDEVTVFSFPVDYEKFFDCINRTTDEWDLSDERLHRTEGCLLIGREIAEKMRVVVANAASGGYTAGIRPWQWYSHYFKPGQLVDPFYDFLDADSRATTTWEQFCGSMIGGRQVRVQGDTEEAIRARMTQDAWDVCSVSKRLGLI